MTAKEMIKLLEQLIEENDGKDMNVLLATQRNYPLVFDINGLCPRNDDYADAESLLNQLNNDALSTEMTPSEIELFEERVKDCQDKMEAAVATIYIGEGNWVGYGSQKYWGD